MKTDRPARCLPFASRRQRGVAAIEFALIFSVLFMGIYGIAAFGGVLYVQQAISRSAEDGARVVYFSNGTATSDDLKLRIQTAVYQSLAASMIAPGNAPAMKEVWLRTHMAETPPEVILSDPRQVEVKVTYPYRDNPLVPPLPLIGNWVPEILFGKAIAARPLS
ncbi:Flp pilus assembly protein TadG [Variovorax boronicumulans]|uniref:TadE/TadG family type IV pilus assembly protein n=1 Tax=Variovorax boronicumulans TaxID=436515 RepID=UPI0027863B7E|nr:TadE/TadG family type IV pilus assembly protein [Variovorax boronicumulans]MDQ0014256.1 Flp pilus assembly protein TadG [Variovorax boronicumulans]